MAENLGTVTLQLDIGDVDQMLREALEEGADRLADAGEGLGGGVPGGGGGGPVIPGGTTPAERAGASAEVARFVQASKAAAKTVLGAAAIAAGPIGQLVIEMRRLDRTLSSPLVGLSPSLAIAAREQAIARFGRDFRRAQVSGPSALEAVRAVEGLRDTLARIGDDITVIRNNATAQAAALANSIIQSDTFQVALISALNTVGLGELIRLLQRWFGEEKKRGVQISVQEANAQMLAEIVNMAGRYPEEFGLPFQQGFHPPIQPNDPDQLKEPPGGSPRPTIRRPMD